jgi:3-oxoacyl-[acyl-carrier-protein] synthase II
MRPIAVVARGAVSPLGEGPRAFAVGEAGERLACCVKSDAELAQLGFRRPNVARAPFSDGGIDRARALLERALALLLEDLDERLPHWRSLRIGLVLGTSAGGMPSANRVFDRRAERRSFTLDEARAAPYFGPLLAFSRLPVEPERTVQILGACASSTIALGIGCRWLDTGRCDLVLAGGYDALSSFVAAGFEALGATTTTIPRPFRKDRDGLALGEGAALLALTQHETKGALGYVLGFGASCDAVHVTAPDRTGAGLAGAAGAALADAGLDAAAIDLVSAHGTATSFNDSAEARAISSVLGANAERVIVQPFKAVVGHTLGAAGALEVLAALDAMARDILPCGNGDGALEPELTARLYDHNAPGKSRHVLKLATAFGGANAALIASPREPQRAAAARSRRRVRLRALGEPQLLPDNVAIEKCSKLSALDVERLDLPSALALSAVVDVFTRTTSVAGERCGIIVGTASATLEVNESFAARLRERGVRGAEPRRFPAT